MAEPTGRRHSCSVTVGARPVQFMHFVELRNMMPCNRSDDVISAISNGLYVDDLLLSYYCPDRALSVWK